MVLLQTINTLQSNASNPTNTERVGLFSVSVSLFSSLFFSLTDVNHYSGNISRRRTVRSDIKTAKSAAYEEAISAFKEEHEIVEKNRKM